MTGRGPHSEGIVTVRAAAKAGLERADFTIAGMKCEGCVEKVEKALLSVTGVERALVSLETGHAVAEFHPDLVEPSRLRAAIDEVGFDAQHRHPPRGEARSSS